MRNRVPPHLLLAVIFCAGWLCAGVLLAAAAKPLTDRPNILFCIADDWAWPHAGAYGDKIVKTPNFDRVAREGLLFTHAFSAAPSCTPSRGAILTGQYPHRLEQGGNLHSFLPKKFTVYPDLLESAGYVVGFTRKGWGPGKLEPGGRDRNPAGSGFKSFQDFFKTVPANKPFCFWYGSTDPHRPYDQGAGLAAGMKPEDVVVPAYLPDTPEIRSDILDYYVEVQRFDRDVGELLAALEAADQIQNTLVVITGDNGWPFPRSKANLYDSGTRQPFALRWSVKFEGGKTLDAFVNLSDLAPTFLEAAGLRAASEMTGQSLLPLLSGTSQRGRDRVFVERERHANARKGDLAYPARAMRTRDFLYIRNFRPDRWPAGDPQTWFAVGPFGDCDGSPSKKFILENQADPAIAKFFQLGFAKRPAEELYDLRKDPDQVVNVAGRPEYAATQKKLRSALERWQKATKDPRASGADDPWDRYPYYGGPAKSRKAPGKR